MVKKLKMADLTKNAISETVRERAKQTEIWDHMGNKSHIFIIPQTSFQKTKSEETLLKFSILKTQRLIETARNW